MPSIAVVPAGAALLMLSVSISDISVSLLSVWFGSVTVPLFDLLQPVRTAAISSSAAAMAVTVFFIYLILLFVELTERPSRSRLQIVCAGA